MKRKYEIAEETFSKKLRVEHNVIICEFPRKYWSEIIYSDMGSKVFLEKVYNTYISEMHLISQFMNIYNSQGKYNPQSMCKLFSLILEIEKTQTAFDI
jgi:hypothetical protein